VCLLVSSDEDQLKLAAGNHRIIMQGDDLSDGQPGPETVVFDCMSWPIQFVIGSWYI
jgi:hypothetical protein